LFDAESSESYASKLFNYLMPIGFGQRCLIAGAPKTGKSTFLRDTARLLCSSGTKAEIFVLLVDQAPELISSYRQFMKAENLVATSYEDDPETHVFAAEFLLKRAKRFAELGRDVILIVDSLTQIAKAYNETDFCIGGKVLPCGLENKTLHYIKKYFGSSRNFVKDGSLSIIATTAMETGDVADDFLQGELSSVANVRIALSDKLARQRIFPAIDIFKSGTRKEELLLNENELSTAYKLRKILTEKPDATDNLIDMLKKTKDNQDLLSKTDAWIKIYNKKNEI
jgi:transcription termination factor Rho